MRNIIPLYPEPPAIIEQAEERDRRECIALDQGVSGANRKLGQWLIDHPSYPNTVVAKWLDCSETRIRYLRKWARAGFPHKPFDRLNQPRGEESKAPTNRPLKTHDNFQEDDFDADYENVEDPKTVLKNVLDTVNGSKALAEACRKVCNVSPFDREAKAEIYNAINLLIVKWKIVQSTLEKKGRGQNGKD
jgi:hypothetical protein